MENSVEWFALDVVSGATDVGRGLDVMEADVEAGVVEARTYRLRRDLVIEGNVLYEESVPETDDELGDGAAEELTADERLRPARLKEPWAATMPHARERIQVMSKF